mgnify:CR=1 FL=1
MPRGRPIVTPLTLTPEQVTSLTQIANSRTAEHRQVQRARILLGAASGKPQKELAEEANLDISSGLGASPSATRPFSAEGITDRSNDGLGGSQAQRTPGNDQ